MSVLCTLRFAGLEFDVDTLVDQFPNLEWGAVRKAGDVRRSNDVASTSTANVSVFEADGKRDFREKWKVSRDTIFALARKAWSLGATDGSIDFGIFIEPEHTLLTGLNLPPHDLEVMSRCGLKLEFSAYLCENDD